MKVVDRLNALDAKVLPPSSDVNRLEQGRLLYLLFLALAASIAWNSYELPGERAAGFVILGYAMYSFGRDVERLRQSREATGETLGFVTFRRYLRAILVVAVFGLFASDYVADRRTPEIDLIGARAVAQTLVDVAAEGEPVDVCRLARDRRSCERDVRSTTGRPQPMVIESVEAVPSFPDTATVTLRSVSGTQLCLISLANVAGRVLVDDPVYWAKDC